MFCAIEARDDGHWCPICAQPYRMTEKERRAIGSDLSRVRRECPGEATIPQPPSLLRRAGNFARSAAGHLAAGMPECSDEQIAARVAVCHSCHLFRPSDTDPTEGTCTHTTCGCRISPRRKRLNKAAWAKELCPLGKWAG